MKKVYEYLQEIRDFYILEDKCHYIKFDNDNPNGEYSKKHKIFCASLDVLSDINEAINSYLNLPDVCNRGLGYLYIYGIISALNVQSDAIKSIIKIVKGDNFDINKDENLDIVRIIRNKIIAHPAEYNEEKSGKKISGFGIIASSMTTFSFQPHIFGISSGDKKNNDVSLYEKIVSLSNHTYQGDHFTINIKELIKNHQSSISGKLKELLDYIKNRE